MPTHDNNRPFNTFTCHEKSWLVHTAQSVPSFWPISSSFCVLALPTTIYKYMLSAALYNESIQSLVFSTHNQHSNPISYIFGSLVFHK